VGNVCILYKSGHHNKKVQGLALKPRHGWRLGWWRVLEADTSDEHGADLPPCSSLTQGGHESR
jgi:hypothetical protein